MDYNIADVQLFLLAFILIFALPALMGLVMDWRDRRKARRCQRQLRSLNHWEDLRRRHSNYLANMREALGSIEGRKSA